MGETETSGMILMPDVSAPWNLEPHASFLSSGRMKELLQPNQAKEAARKPAGGSVLLDMAGTMTVLSLTLEELCYVLLNRKKKKKEHQQNKIKQSRAETHKLGEIRVDKDQGHHTPILFRKYY